MIVRLRDVKGNAPYIPPFPVTMPTEEPIDRSLPLDDQIMALTWIPAILVSRFLYQYPNLDSEADELFSVGIEVVVDMVNRDDVDGDDLIAWTVVNARRTMEVYASGLDSVVKVCQSTRYNRAKQGRKVPSSGELTEHGGAGTDDTERIIELACQALDLDIRSASFADRKQIADYLGLTT